MPNEKGKKLLTGCIPQSAEEKSIYEQLVRIFAPVVYFDPNEQFFPVDLPSYLFRSALYKFKGRSDQKVKDYGNVKTEDLVLVEENSFTTVAGWTYHEKEEGNLIIEEPVPNIKKIYDNYSTGFIPAKLTTYATICRLKDMPNNHLLRNYPPRLDEISARLDEGLLINYYFYFPAVDSPYIKREGDWSGISILLRRLPDSRELISGEIEHFPLLTCYFKKTFVRMIGALKGFRFWDKVTVKEDERTGLKTHPVLYFSKGTHNCYYEPVKDVHVSDGDLYWKVNASSTMIESGNYIPGSSNRDAKGDNNTDNSDEFYTLLGLSAICIIFLPFALCPARAIPAKITPLPIDSIEPGGYECDPRSIAGQPVKDDSYPPEPAVTGGHPLNLKLNVVYVDFDDKATRESWEYNGFWGAARVEIINEFTTGGIRPINQYGFFGGFRRPNLGPWFLWNLFWNSEIGSNGGAEDS